MKEIWLNFPAFFNCAVKKYTPLFNYNAVSILLIGRARSAGEGDPLFISDTAVSHYIAGSIQIKDEILGPLQDISQSEAVRRIKKMGFQNYELVAKKCIGLIMYVKGLMPATYDGLFNLINDKSKNIEDRYCEFIAAVFLLAIHCRKENVRPLTKAEKKHLDELEITDDIINTVPRLSWSKNDLLLGLIPSNKSNVDPILKLKDELLWIKLNEKLMGLANDDIYVDQYLAGIEDVIRYSLDFTSSIQENYPMCAQHGEEHILNVLHLMTNLLGDRIEDLSRNEIAALILSAYCHDIGLGFQDKEEILKDRDRLDQYLNTHRGEYVKAYRNGTDAVPFMSSEMVQKYLRNIQHDKVAELLYQFEWPPILEVCGLKESVICICQSHRELTPVFNSLVVSGDIDLRLCAVLLRIADIMDFDTSRAPQPVYDQCEFDKGPESANRITKEQWLEYRASHSFDFHNITDRSYPYDLKYHSRSKSMQIEQAVNLYIDWLDQELLICSNFLTQLVGKWQDFILPAKIKRMIVSDGYISGQYRFTLDQDRILSLLIGEELYRDPSVFVRELLQNSIDAVRTRQQLDKCLPAGWVPQIKIRTWADNEGYHWFRIQDNGIGMTEEIIKDFFLKVGSSYYSSDEFQQEKLRCKASPDFMPISRFGIGVLSCFMGNSQVSQVEVSTKRFSENGVYPSALRLSIQGMNGYYYMGSKSLHHLPGPMKGVTLDEQMPYLEQAGTVIAVRTNLYQSGLYTGFKEILDKYIIYPPIPIHYDGDEGSFDYVTEEEFMDTVYSITPSIKFEMPQKYIEKIDQILGCNTFASPPVFEIKCLPLNKYTKSPYLTGAVFCVFFRETHHELEVRFGKYQTTCEMTTGFKTDGRSGGIYAWVNIKFPAEFEKQVGGKLLQYQEYAGKNKKDILYNHIKEVFADEELKLTIAQLLIFVEFQYDGWENAVIEKYKISQDEFDQARTKVSCQISAFPEYPFSSEEEADAISKCLKAFRGWEFKIGKFEDIDWYNNYFLSISQITGHTNIVSHNGILCGDADFFCKSDKAYNVLGIVMLLKDKYRPDLYVARDGIQDIPLELACDLALIHSFLQKDKVDLNAASRPFGKTNFSYIPMKLYWDILNSRPDICNHLQIYSNAVPCLINAIPYLLEEREAIVLDDTELLYGLKTMDSLYKNLCIAYLRKTLSLRVAFVSNDLYFTERIYIVNKTEKLDPVYLEVFPAQFFLLPLDESSPYLTNSHAHTRRTCNAKHRLSQFMINNVSLLQKYVPGILTGLIHTLAECSGDLLINNVNCFIKQLRKIKSVQAEVPVDLELTNEDLY